MEEAALETGRLTRLTVYDLLGREVATLVNGTLPAGAHSANTDCSSQRSVDACSGVQFCAWDGSVCDYSSSTNGQINKNLFVVLSFCYQFGVLISRSSLNYVKVKCAKRPPISNSHFLLCKL